MNKFLMDEDGHLSRNSECKPLTYDQIQHNEPIYYIQKYWNRELTEHERNLVALTYDWTRTTQEAEEVRILDDIQK